MIKLIATDLDGTLFYPKNPWLGTSFQNRAFLRRFVDQGGKVLVASGRSIKIVPALKKLLHRDITLLGCNGGFIYEKGVFEERQPLNRDRLLDLFSALSDDFGIICWFLFDDTETMFVYTTPSMSSLLLYGTLIGNKINGYYRENLLNDNRIFVDRISSHDTFKLMPVFGLGKKARQRANETYLAFKARYGDNFNIAASNNALEITAKGADKGAGVERYCLDHKIDKNDVLVIGDSGNDLSMFGRFPHSVSMAHSAEHIRSQANHVVHRVADLSKFIEDPSQLAGDTIKETDYEKALSNL